MDYDTLIPYSLVALKTGLTQRDEMGDEGPSGRCESEATSLLSHPRVLSVGLLRFLLRKTPTTSW
jgi:hypothetical protein